MTDFNEYFSNKKVIIIGPAPHVVETLTYDFVDQYDIIIRFSRALPIPEKYHYAIHNRTDVLVHPLVDSSTWKFDAWIQGITFGIWCSKYENKGYEIRHQKNFKKLNNNRIKLFFNSKDDYHTLHRKCSSPPLSGLCIIYHLLMNCLPSEVYLSGLTFYRTLYYKEYNAKHSKWKHKPEKILKYFKDELYQNHKNILKLDNKLQKIINEDI